MIKIFVFAFVVPNGLPTEAGPPQDFMYNTTLLGVYQAFSSEVTCRAEMKKAEEYLTSINARFKITAECKEFRSPFTQETGE